MNLLPATPEALSVPDEEFDQAPVQQPQGLPARFRVGEQFPWKGLWFEVEAVSFDRMTFKPVGMTWQRYKQVKNQRRK